MGHRRASSLDAGIPSGSANRRHTQRRPGPVGLVDGHAPAPNLRRPGPLGLHPDEPAHKRFSDAEIAAGQRELELIGKVFGAFKKEGDNIYYVYSVKNVGMKTKVERYLEDRIEHFGPGTNYQDHLARAHEQLEANGGKLRQIVDPPKKHDPQHKIFSPRITHPDEWKPAQDIFYAWVLRSCEKAGWDIDDVPQLVLTGISKELRETLKRVRATYGPARYDALKLGLANPRPKKAPSHGAYPGSYRLGTLSDHALGNAVDINAGQNPQINAKDWELILTFTHESLDEETRESKWHKDPKSLYDAITHISEAFVRGVEVEMQKVRDHAKAKAGTDPAKLKAAAALSDADCIEAVVNGNAALKLLPKAWVKAHRSGFFNLPWPLVKALADEHCVWGVVFTTVDLHHFQLPDPPPLPAGEKQAHYFPTDKNETHP